MKISEKIVNEMYANDAFSKWLGIEKIEISKGNPDHRSYKFIPAQQKWWRFGL